MYTLVCLFGLWGNGFLWVVAEYLFYNVLDRCPKEVLNVCFPPGNEGASTKGFKDIRSETECFTLLLELSFRIFTFFLRSFGNASSA